MQDAHHISSKPRRSARIWRRIIVGCLLAFLAVEGLLRALVAPMTLLEPTSDDYWREHFRATPDLATDIEHDVHLGWRMRRNFQGDGVTHDADGHRVSPRKGASDPTKRPAVFLGDSFTYGLGVRDEETFAARFAELAQGRAVFNFAANGHGLDQQVLAFEAEGVVRNPSLVVVGYFVDDFRRSGLSFREARKPHFELEKGDLHLSGDPVPTTYEERVSLSASSAVRSYTWAGLKMLWSRVTRSRGTFVSDADFDRHALLSYRLLARLKQSTDALGAKLIVLVIPHCTYDGYAESARIEAAIDASCSQLEITCIAMRGPLRNAEAEGRVVFSPSCHWSAAGHALAAKLLVEQLTALGIER